MSRVRIRTGQYLKTGDTEPDLGVQLIKDNDAPKQLDTAQDVEVHLAEANGETVVDDNLAGSVSIDDESNGDVTYEWSDGDTDTARTLIGEFVVIDENGEQSSYPNDSEFKIYIEDGVL